MDRRNFLKNLAVGLIGVSLPKGKTSEDEKPYAETETEKEEKPVMSYVTTGSMTVSYSYFPIAGSAVVLSPFMTHYDD